MTTTTLEDVRWLTGSEARTWLDRLAHEATTSVALAERLRRELSPARAHLVLEQVALRQRAIDKFADARQMFFTPRGLEQSTDDLVAAAKAARFPRDLPIVDICCGIGGDLRALAQRGPVAGVERDSLVAALAAANCPAAEIQVVDAADVEVEQYAAWHIDPDRRASGRRTTRVEFADPPDDVLQALLGRNPDAAMKLAPAADVTAPWMDEGSLEWFSRDGQCRQLVAWFGDLTLGSLSQHPNERAATIIRSGRAETVTFRGQAELETTSASQVGRYVYEPDSAIIAARLTGALAQQFALQPVASNIAYLTGDAAHNNIVMSAFEVVDVMPLDVKRVKAWLRERRIGRLEVKKRGVAIEPEEMRRRLRVDGEDKMTLLVAPIEGRVTAILARRVVSAQRPGPEVPAI